MKISFNERQDKLYSVFAKIKSVMRSCNTEEQLNAAKSWGMKVVDNWTEHFVGDLGSFYALYLHGFRDAMYDSINEVYKCVSQSIKK